MIINHSIIFSVIFWLDPNQLLIIIDHVFNSGKFDLIVLKALFRLMKFLKLFVCYLFVFYHIFRIVFNGIIALLKIILPTFL